MATCCETKEPLCSEQRVHRVVHTLDRRFILNLIRSLHLPRQHCSVPHLFKKTRPTFELKFTFLHLGLRRRASDKWERNLARRKQHLLSFH